MIHLPFFRPFSCLWFLKINVYTYWKWVTDRNKFHISLNFFAENISRGWDKKWGILSSCQCPLGEESAGPKSLQISFLASDFTDIPATEKVLKTIVRTHQTKYGLGFKTTKLLSVSISFCLFVYLIKYVPPENNWPRTIERNMLLKTKILLMHDFFFLGGSILVIGYIISSVFLKLEYWSGIP